MWRAEETQLCGVKRSWEIIADNLSKAGLELGLSSQRLIPATGERSGLQTRIATQKAGFVVRADGKARRDRRERSRLCEQRRWEPLRDRAGRRPGTRSFPE